MMRVYEEYQFKSRNYGVSPSVLSRFEELLETRAKLTLNPLIKQTDYPIDTNVFFGNRYEIAYQFLQRLEKEPIRTLWLTQDNPFFCGYENPLRVAQFEFQAPVLSKSSLQEDFFLLLNGSNASALTIVEMNSTEWLIDAMEAIALNGDQESIIVHFSEIFPTVLFDQLLQDRFLDACKKLKVQGRKVLFGAERYPEDFAINQLRTRLEGMLKV